MLKKFVLLFVVMVMSSAMVGCNTMEGAGRDVERAGDKIEDAAD